MKCKVILISGLTQGLGSAMTDEFIRLGHRVLRCGRSSEAIPLNPGVIDTDMLRSCFGTDAGNYPTADEWAQTAVY